MNTNLIIGAGQLGSRHLQGLLKADITQQVFVLDPSAASLETAAARAAEISHRAVLNWVSSWEQLPVNLDLVIVATGANVRAAVVEKLLKEHRVRYLVLEKVLFQDPGSYERIGSLIRESGTPAWVNHPRRMYAHYQQIRETLAKDPGPVLLTASGTNWGLACNAMHLVDLCCYLTGSAVTAIDLGWTDPVIHPSKRSGYIEFTGSLCGSLSDNSRLILTSLPGDPGPLTITLAAAAHRWMIQEGAHPSMVMYSRSDGFAAPTHSVLLNEFQSGLTTRLAEQLLHQGDCGLPVYAEACQAHLPFINAALKRYNELSGLSVEKVPIT